MIDHLWLPYTQMKTQKSFIHAEEAYGTTIVLKDGSTLIDGIASWWTACHGYRHKKIEERVIAQMKKMPHMMLGGIVHDPALNLSKKLTGLLDAPLEHVFFSESGSVSVEIAMKMAIQYFQNCKQPEKKKFISFNNGYHGDTFAAMSVCDPNEGMHARFNHSLIKQYVIDIPSSEPDFSHLESFIESVSDHTAAIIIEPILQAAGGMKLHDVSILERIVRLARKHNLIVIFDEIATGFGRTGKLFAYQHTNIVPDIITLSKALTGGTLPLAATVASKKIYESFLTEDYEDAFMHGPTYCGNPLACSAALASIEIFEEEPRLEQARDIEAFCKASLNDLLKYSIAKEIRCMGAMAAIELSRHTDLIQLRAYFLEEGVWIRPLNNVIYIMPSLNIDKSSLEKLIKAIEQIIQKIN